MPLPDLDELIAEVDRNCTTASPGTQHDQPDWIELLTTAVGVAGQLQRLADELIEDYIEHCRLHGYTWTDIGAALGVTRQAAQQRFQVPHKRYQPEELSEELQQAMAAMKQLAVRQRNNYIGTEHLLWGILAEENSATKLLASLDIPRDVLLRSVENRLTLGASRAAERIAWTPYSRRAIALAEDISTEQSSTLIGCNHLLFGLSDLGRGVAAAVLAEAGADHERLKATHARSHA